MKINFDRLSELAGISSKNKRFLSENVDLEKDMNEEEEDLEVESYLQELDELEEGDDNEVIEVDEVELVQELRRAKKIMQENRRRQLAASRRNINESRRRKQAALSEAQLKRAIDQEVQNVLEELNLNSDWVYGKNKPRRSKNGYSHQGSYLKGFGFK